MAHAVSLDALRQRIREIEGAQVRVRRVPSGVQAIDAVAGGLPVPGILEIHGAVGSGRTRLALALAREIAAQRRPIAWVDAERRLYPPAVHALGLPLDRLVLVLPPSDRVGWAVEQLARSGCYPVVFVADPPRIGRAGTAWGRAAEAGGATLVVLRERPSRELPATVRLGVGRGEVTAVRNRGAVPGRCAPLPPWPEPTSPWA